jgi:hypothetical protein
MSCTPGSFLDGIPTRLINVNLIPQIYESDEEYLLPNNYELKLHDVLCGQMKSAGNERFRIIAEMRVHRYLNATSRREKVQIVTEMVDAVRQAGGNFIRLVQRNSDYPDGASIVYKQQWMDIGNLKAREKASHALRCCASKYQKSKTEALARSFEYERFKSSPKPKRDVGVTHSSCITPPQKKLRRVCSVSSSSIKNMPTAFKDDAVTFKQNTTAISLNDLLLFNTAGALTNKMFHDLRFDVEEGGFDSINHSAMLRPTVEFSMPPHMISHSPSMNRRFLEANTLTNSDSCFSKGGSLRKHSLVEANCGFIINDEDLLDLFDFKEAIV